MLVLKNIVKDYDAGGGAVQALRGVNLAFRDNEFVAVLGPSGCGKTTLLNIIGGLDHYTSGNMSVDGKSTELFGDRDWDTYRNHRIGFVFQNYNLIPHQSVLSNVELALTISGVSKAERKKRAEEALEKVGLKEQIRKKPNQLSGGQMQRVAIARALVNDPEILLADEPTGALDSATSVQVMDILKDIASDRLVIMVTHNPDLAETYATRIIRLLDGEVQSDSNPYTADNEAEEKPPEPRRKYPSMSFLTALSLSFKNLLTKKTRTFMVSFAGSIGIIGIALILSVSAGVQAYIDRVQQDTLASYPITLQAETVDMASLMTTFAEENGAGDHPLDKVYENPIIEDLTASLANAETNRNNLTDFQKFLKSDVGLKRYTSAVQYGYNINPAVYTEDTDGKIVKSDTNELMMNLMMGDGSGGGISELRDTFGGGTGFSVWEELLPGSDGTGINSVLKQQYDLLYGKWPDKFNEVVLVVDEHNEISDLVLYALGLRTEDEMREAANLEAHRENGDAADTGETSSAAVSSSSSSAASSAAGDGDRSESETDGKRKETGWSYADICALKLKLILPADCYQKQKNGVYVDLRLTDTGVSYLYDNDETSTEIKIAGVIRPNKDAVASMLSGGIGYTAALADYIIDRTASKQVVTDQLASTGTDVLTGLPFENGDDDTMPDSEKAEKFNAYRKSLTPAKKAELYTSISSIPNAEMLDSAAKQAVEGKTREEKIQTLITAMARQMNVDSETVQSYVNKMSDEDLDKSVAAVAKEAAAASYAAEVAARLGAMTTDQLAGMLDAAQFTEEQAALYYDSFMPNTVSPSTYEDNLEKIGYIDKSKPAQINLYATSFENKEGISDRIAAYNEGVSEEDKITYTDYVALMMSSISTIINAISYVLIAFVAISLIVSSIMIGIITYISVLERTKEIGVLRAIGASKRDISRVFNAETLIIGFMAGLIGILTTLLLLIPINIILHKLTGIGILSARLPAVAAVILVGISMLLTFIAGLIPSGIAAKKDPVIALRSE